MRLQKCFFILLELKWKKLCGKYAPLIYSASLSYNPLKEENLNVSEIFHENKDGVSNINSEDKNNHTGNAENNTTGTSNTLGNSNSASYNTGSSLTVSSDTPQGQINKEELLKGKWATSTSATENSNEVQDFTYSNSQNNLTNKDTKTESSEDKGTSKTNTNSNEIRDYERIRKGYDLRKTKSELIAEYRKNIFNIYEEIVKDLNPLFFALF